MFSVNSPSTQPLFQEALRVIRAVPGYGQIGMELAQMAAQEQICVDPALEDRAQVGLMGIITLGPEALDSSALSLAQTLIHEHFHLHHQSPWLKTLSFWSGVARGEPVMKRYEQPAYQAAHDFLETVKRTRPRLSAQAEAEQRAIRQVFASQFGGKLN